MLLPAPRERGAGQMHALDHRVLAEVFDDGVVGDLAVAGSRHDDRETESAEDLLDEGGLRPLVGCRLALAVGELEQPLRLDFLLACTLVEPISVDGQRADLRRAGLRQRLQLDASHAERGEHVRDGVVVTGRPCGTDSAASQYVEHSVWLRRHGVSPGPCPVM